jgi:hypothetical protein
MATSNNTPIFFFQTPNIINKIPSISNGLIKHGFSWNPISLFCQKAALCAINKNAQKWANLTLN